MEIEIIIIDQIITIEIIIENKKIRQENMIIIDHKEDNMIEIMTLKNKEMKDNNIKEDKETMDKEPSKMNQIVSMLEI